MIPELIFWWALAVMALLSSGWFLAATAIAIHALFKPRGKAANAHVVMRDRDPQVRS